MFMVKKKIAKVCLDVYIEEDGAMTVARSSGNAKIDSMVLDLLQGSETIAGMARKASLGSDGRKRLPLDFDHTSFHPKGKIYCAAEPSLDEPR